MTGLLSYWLLGARRILLAQLKLHHCSLHAVSVSVRGGYERCREQPLMSIKAGWQVRNLDEFSL